MELFILSLLIIAGFILYIVEVFLVPGFGLTGIASICCLAYGNYYSFVHIGPTAGFITLAITLLGGIAITVWFSRKLWRRLL